MKRLCVFLLMCAVLPAVAQDTYTMDNLIAKIERVGEPYVDGDFVIFTAEDNARHVGIAFDFEGFKTIHSFQRLSKTDMDGEVTGSLYFFILEVPKSIHTVVYRIVIDGLWTIDPTNPSKIFDDKSNMMMSRVDIPRQDKPMTSIPSDNTVHFVYQGLPGRHIRLGGSFTNWDSSIYVMKETSPGFYELEIALPKGTYYYAYYEGISSFIDATNPNRAYTPDGRTASVITVE